MRKQASNAIRHAIASEQASKQANGASKQSKQAASPVQAPGSCACLLREHVDERHLHERGLRPLQPARDTVLVAAQAEAAREEHPAGGGVQSRW